MPLRIMKIVFSAEVTTTAGPVVTRFFHTLADEATAGPLTLAVDVFEDDNGDPAAAFPALTADNAYFNCYVNGVLQMEGAAAYTEGGTGVGQLVITVGADETIAAGTPIILEVVNFSPTSTVEIET